MAHFHLPDLGEGLSSATLHVWHVEVGDTIEIDQPLLSVETAKAVVEVPSPFTGTVTALLAQAGGLVEVGAPLVDIASDDQSPATVVGQLPHSQQTSDDQAPVHEQVHALHRPRAMPAVRQMAEALGIDLTHTTGSGPNNSIVLQDLIAHLPSKADPILEGHMRQMAHTMQQAHREVVAATLQENLYFDEKPKTLMLCLIKACIEACQAVPKLNAHYKPFATYQCFETVDLAIAINSQHGLFTPVMKQVQNQSNDMIETMLIDFKAKACAHSFAPEEMSTPTFTLSNIGSIAGTFGTPIVVPPSVGILAVGSMMDRLHLSEDNKTYMQHVLPLSLSFDHRVVTGAEAATWLQHFKSHFLCQLAAEQAQLSTQISE